MPSYDWLLFTSANGVRHFLTHLEASPYDLRAIKGRLCAIGPATKKALEDLHLKVDLMPTEYVAESLLEAFANEDLQGKRVLLPRAAVARDLIPAEFTRRGAHIDVVEAYRTVLPEESRILAPGLFDPAHKPDWITFTSTSTVENFLTLAGPEALDGVRIASIGPITTAALRRHNLEVAVEAAPYTMDGLAAALLHGSPLPQ